MKTKTIPFDLETAKKIQSGEVAGAIKTKNGLYCKIVSYCDGTDFFVERTTEVRIHRWCYPYTKDGYFIDGKFNGGTNYDLVLEVPDNEPQFKPFDRVLVRNDDEEIWQPRLYEMYSGGTEKHYCQDGVGYLQCIPYEGNKHLVGTTNNPK